MKCLILALCVVCLSIAEIHCNVAQSARGEIQLFDLPGPTWGDVSPPYYFQIRFTKIKVPFITRCNSFKYPLDVAQSPESAKATFVPSLRGISHVNLVDKKDTDCADPDVWIDEGGLNEPLTKVKVCSKTGCPLDSVIYFYGRK